MTKTINAITVQDEYIAKVVGYDQRGYNYSALVTRASRKAMANLMDLGLSETQSQALIIDAHAMAKLQKAAA